MPLPQIVTLIRLFGLRPYGAHPEQGRNAKLKTWRTCRSCLWRAAPPRRDHPRPAGREAMTHWYNFTVTSASVCVLDRTP